MSCRGVHFALRPEQREKLLTLPDGAERLNYLQTNIEREWDKEFLQETDTAWDAIHRCLTGQADRSENLDFGAGTYPLNRCILGGRNIYSGEIPYIMCLIEPEEVRDLAAALEPLDKAWLTEAYHTHCKDVWPEYGDDDCEYTWEYLSLLKDFFKRIAPTGRAVLFSADQ